MSVQQIRYGGRDIPFSLQLNSRKRVRIEVLPSGTVQVLAPTGTGIETVVQIVQGKARWIARQQRYFQQFDPRTTSREFVSGETHLYLGRRYRLKVHSVDDGAGVKLAGPYMHLSCPEAADTDAKRALLDIWYLEKAGRIFAEVLDTMLGKKAFKVLNPPKLSIRPMHRRWGSCTARGRVTLNPSLVRAPRRCIEYVVAHELCHLIVPDHSREFLKLLSRVMPDWKARKELLERILA